VPKKSLSFNIYPEASLHRDSKKKKNPSLVMEVRNTLILLGLKSYHHGIIMQQLLFSKRYMKEDLE
jgi:hypothetical protein